MPSGRKSPRLSVITTRAGDGGETSLADGTRIAKDDPRIEALGALDELNCHLGLLCTDETLDEAVLGLLIWVRHRLFDAGSVIAAPAYSAFPVAAVERLDATIAEFTEALGPLAEFILPGGTPAAAQCHVCRAVCRRAERRLVAMTRVGQSKGPLVQFLNRLSDLLFQLARHINQQSGYPETSWIAHEIADDA